MAEDVDTSLEGLLPMGQVQHHRLQVVESVSEQAFRRIAVVFQDWSAVALCALLTNQMAPDERQAEQPDQFANALRFRQMSGLQIKAARLQGRKERLDLPAPPVERERFIRCGRGGEDEVLIFGEPLADHVCGDVAKVAPFQKNRLRRGQEPGRTSPQAAPVRPGRRAPGGGACAGGS